MVLTQFKVPAVILLLFANAAALSRSNLETPLSECRLDVNQKNDAHRQLKETHSFNDGYTEGPTFYDVKNIRPFDLTATFFRSDLYGMDPRYTYVYTTNIDTKFTTAKSAMLKSYGKSKCDVSTSQGSRNSCEISTGLPTKNTASGPRGAIYRPQLSLIEFEGKVWFRCQYAPA